MDQVVVDVRLLSRDDLGEGTLPVAVNTGDAEHLAKEAAAKKAADAKSKAAAA